MNVPLYFVRAMAASPWRWKDTTAIPLDLPWELYMRKDSFKGPTVFLNSSWPWTGMVKCGEYLFEQRQIPLFRSRRHLWVVYSRESCYHDRLVACSSMRLMRTVSMLVESKKLDGQRWGDALSECERALDNAPLESGYVLHDEYRHRRPAAFLTVPTRWPTAS